MPACSSAAQRLRAALWAPHPESVPSRHHMFDEGSIDAELAAALFSQVNCWSPGQKKENTDIERKVGNFGSQDI